MKLAASAAALFLGLAHPNMPLFAQQDEMAGAAVDIVDAKLGKAVENRELVDETATFALNDRVYLWLKVANASGDSVTVTWKHGEHMYATTLGIGGTPWRTWAYKTASAEGEWSVSVSDMNGNLLKEMSFSVAGAAEMPAKGPEKQQ